MQCPSDAEGESRTISIRAALGGVTPRVVMVWLWTSHAKVGWYTIYNIQQVYFNSQNFLLLPE